MTDYTKTTDFTSKDSLPSGDSGKIIRGAEFGTEFDNIQTAVNSKSNIDNPSFTGNITVTGTVDGRDIAADGTKLDTIETSADVTDTANVTAAGALMDSEVTNLAQVKAFDSADYATAAQGTTADNALPKTGGAMTGAITTNSTFDGRDVATDGTKLDTVETNADVTDTANVTAAGALMDSELTDIASVKALNQGVATTDTPTFAGVTANGTVEFDGLSGTGAVTVTDILDQDDMSGNSATALATQQSIKAYVDSQVGTVDTLAEVLANGNATGGTDIAVGTGDDITFAVSSKAIFGAGSDLQIYHDGSNSYVRDAGAGDLYLQGSSNVQIEGADGSNMMYATTGAQVRLFYAGSPKFNTTSTGIDVTGTVTADGLTVDGTGNLGTIGNGAFNTAAALGFQSDRAFFGYSSSQNALIQSGASKGVVVEVNSDTLDGGTRAALFASNGDISFYEDTGTTAKLEWLASAETLKFADNGKAVFGADSDLEIYHSTSHSIIADVGTGDLLLRGNNARLQNSDGSQTFVHGFNNGAVEIFHSGTKKFETTIGGIDVTGTATMDALTVDGIARVDGNVTIGRTTGSYVFTEVDGGNERAGIHSSADNDLTFKVNNQITAINIDGTTRDISFYEDTGTTPKLFWDASAESLGIGTSTPASLLQLLGSPVATSGALATFRNSDATSSNTSFGGILFNSSPGTDFSIGKSNVNAVTTLSFRNGNTGASYMDIASSGNVGVGTSSPAADLQINDGNTTRGVAGTFHMYGSAVNGDAGDVSNEIFFRDESVSGWGGAFIRTVRSEDDQNGKDALTFGTSPSGGSVVERMRIDSSGQVGIGTSSPETNLHIEDSSSFSIIRLVSSTTENAGIDFGDPDDRDIGRVRYNNSDNSMVFHTNAAEQMRIDASGNVGVGTSSPSTLLHVKSTGATTATIEAGGGGDAILDIKAAEVSGGESIIRFSDSVSGVGFITYAQNDGGSDFMRFGTASTERMRIDSSGNLLVGTTSLADVDNKSTAHLLEGASSIGGRGAVGVYNNTGTANCPALVVLNRDASTDTSNRFIQFYADVSSSGSTAMGGIVGNGASNVQFAALSDAREKTNIKSISGSLTKINSLNPVEFDWIASGEHINAGFVAQEVGQVFPEFVVENMAEEGAEERKGLTGGMTGGIVAHLVKAIQEQTEIINDLRARVAQLETN